MGTAAALAIQNGTTMAQFPIAKLQQKLKADGVHLEDIPISRPAVEPLAI
jgi:hypothetical protein